MNHHYWTGKWQKCLLLLVMLIPLLFSGAFHGSVYARIPAPINPLTQSSLASPMLAFPKGEIRQAQSSFQWEEVAGADSYHLMLYRGQETLYDSWIEASSACDQSTCQTLLDLNFSTGSYQWQVQPAAGFINGPFSSATFDVKLGPDAVSLMTPQNRAKLTAQPFTWKPVAEAESYRLEITRLGDTTVYSSWFAAQDVCTNGACSASPETALVDGVYTWRVQTRDEVYEGAWSNERRFSVGKAAPYLIVNVSAESNWISSDQATTIQVTVTNEGDSAAHNVALHNDLPAQLAFVSGSGARLDAASGAVLAQIGSLPAGQSRTVTYDVRAVAATNSGDAITDALQVTYKESSQPLTAEVALGLIDAALEWSPIAADSASQIRTDRIQVEIPQGAYDGHEGALVIRPQSVAASSALPIRFEITTLVDAQSRTLAAAPLHREGHQQDRRQTLMQQHPQFAKPVTLTIQFDGVADLSALSDDQQPYVVYWDEAGQAWIRQPITSIDLAANAVTVETTHFSTWGAGVSGSFPTNGTSISVYDEANVALFSGKASYSYPLWVPTGRAGMSPSIALSYSSATVDGVIGDIQSPWVGLGWNIDSIEISRMISNTYIDGVGMIYGYQNQFLMTFNGTGYTLVEDSYHLGRYRTENESFLYVQRHSPMLGNQMDGTTAPPNQSDEWWEVVTANGTRYRIGWEENAEQMAPMPDYNGSQQNPVFEVGPDSDLWDGDGVSAPTVLDMGDGSYRMWYMGRETGKERIGMAVGASRTNWIRIAPYEAKLYEAEDGIVGSPMSIQEDVSASGCSYVFPGSANQGYVDIPIVASATGNASIWIYAIDPNYTFSVLNSAQTVIASGTWNVDNAGGYQWEKYTTTVPLTAGASYTLRFVPLNNGSHLDAAYVTFTSEKPMARYCGSAVVLSTGATGSWTETRVSDPEVLKVGSTYHMWFTGANSGTSKIGHATSTDGEHWSMDANPVLDVGASGSWENQAVAQPTVVYNNGTYHMWYSGKHSGDWQIGHATSTDGVNWTKDTGNPVKRNGATWKKTFMLDPEVIWNGSTYMMWVVDKAASNAPDEIWVGTMTTAVNWAFGSTPTLSLSGWMGGNFESPSVLFDGTTYHMWFGAKTNQVIGYASATGNPATTANWTLSNDTTGNLYDEYAGATDHNVAQRWRVDRVTDVHGNTITYDYDEEVRVHSSATYERASYLSKIRYTGTNGQACVPANGGCYEVVFVTKSRELNDNGNPLSDPIDMPRESDIHNADTWDSKYLDKIQIHALIGTSDTIIRTYDLATHEMDRKYTNESNVTTKWDSLVLDSLTTYAGDGGTGSLASPKLSFTYTNLENRSSHNGQRNEWEYPRLTTIHNGTDADVTLTYEHVASGNGDGEYYWRILRREGTDGVTADVRSVEYTYQTPCHSNKGQGWCNLSNSGGLVGYGLVTETIKDFDGSTIRQVKHYFKLDQKLSGREWKTETYDSNGVLQARSETDFAAFNRSNQSGYPNGVKFIYISETRQFEKRSGYTDLQLVMRSTFVYDPMWGDQVEQRLYDGTSTTPHTTTVSDFIENIAYPTTFLHSFGRSSITYAGEPTINNVISASYSAYDGTAAGLGTKGELTLSQTKTLLAANQAINTSYVYDSYGNVTSTRQHGVYGTVGTLPTTNSADRVSSIIYDSTFHAFPVTSTNPLGHQSSIVYDFQQTGKLPLGLATESTDPNGATSKTVYDGLGRTIEVWQPGAAQASVKTLFPTLNGSGEITAPYSIELQIWDDGRFDDDGNGTLDAAKYRSATAFYDGIGRILRTVGPAEAANTYIQSDTHFNAMGQVDASTAPYQVTSISAPPATWNPPSGALVTTTSYDDLGRAIQVTAPGGITSTTIYDGRKTTLIDPNGHQKVSVTDNLGRLIRVYEYSGTGTTNDPYVPYPNTTPATATVYTYDVRNLLQTVTDTQGNVTTINYDAMGRKTSMDDPDMGVWSYTYTDVWGQIDTQTDARGAQIHFVYDPLGRVTQRQARMSSSQSWATVATYTYDSTTNGNKGIGRLTGSASVYVGGSPTITDALFYNLLGQVTSSTRTLDGTAYQVQMSYDSIGRAKSTTLPTGEVVYTNYNARGLAESLSGLSTYVASTNYMPSGSVDTQTLGNGVITDFSYEATTNRLQRILIQKSTSPALVDLTYDYDNAGNIESMVDGVRGETRTFTYDHLDRLLTADVTVGQSNIDARDYAYDEIGNILSFQLNSNPVTTYTYPAATAPRPHAATGLSTGQSYVYDANGNMTSRSFNGTTWAQTFDAENRLVTVDDGDTLTTYIYDGDGGRVKRIVDDGTTLTTTLYVSGMEIEKVGSSETKRTIYYSMGGAFRIIEGSTSTVQYTHSDHLGSTSVLSDASGAKVLDSDVVFAPYGEVRSGDLNDLVQWTDFGFTGQKHDLNTGGLMYYGARYYLPELHKFISADTVVPGAGNPQAWNRYAYVLNNPVRLVDPSGHVPTCADLGEPEGCMEPEVEPPTCAELGEPEGCLEPLPAPPPALPTCAELGELEGCLEPPPLPPALPTCAELGEPENCMAPVAERSTCAELGLPAGCMNIDDQKDCTQTGNGDGCEPQSDPPYRHEFCSFNNVGETCMWNETRMRVPTAPEGIDPSDFASFFSFFPPF